MFQTTNQYHIMTYCDPVICGTYPISTWLRVPSQAGANIKNHRNSTVLNPPMSWDILFDAHPFDVFFGISPVSNHRKQTKHHHPCMATQSFVKSLSFFLKKHNF
jgi:hypothetical protein